LTSGTVQFSSSTETEEENTTREYGPGTSIIDDQGPGFTDEPGIRI
jgi:hypothetical protein